MRGHIFFRIFGSWPDCSGRAPPVEPQAVGARSTLAISGAFEQRCSRCKQEMAPRQRRVIERREKFEGRCHTTGIRQCHGVIQSQNRAVTHCAQLPVVMVDRVPIRGRQIRRGCMHRSDSGLEVIATDAVSRHRPFEPTKSSADRFSIPERSILFEKGDGNSSALPG